MQQKINFEAFQITNKTQQTVRKTGIFELTAGIIQIVFGLMFLILFCAYTTNAELLINFLGKVLGVVDAEGNVLGAFFAIYAGGIGVVFVAVGIMQTVSGTRTLIISKNPILLLENKVQFFAMGILYAVLIIPFVVLFFIASGVFCYILLSLAVITLCALTVLKILASKMLPKKEDVLDIEKLPKDARELLEQHLKNQKKKHSKKTV